MTSEEESTMRTRNVCAIVAIVLAVSVGTVAVSAQTSGSGNTESAWVRVSAFLNVPLAGADVAVYDIIGQSPL